MGGVCYPAGVAIVDACAGGCVLGSERKLELPEEHMPPRLRRKLPSIKISAEGREQRSESYIFYSSTCDMYSSSSCDGATHDMYCQRCYVRYVIGTVSTAAAQRATYTSMYVVYSTQRVIRTAAVYSSCDGAAHVLSTLLRAVCPTCSIYSNTAAAAVVLPFYAATMWVIASPYTYCQSFYKQTEQQYHSCRQLYRFLRDPHPYSHTLTSTFPHHHPPPASRHKRWTP